MSIRRIAVLLKKEWKYGSRGFFFVFAVAAPFILTVFINLVFGSLFSGKPKVGVFDMGHSSIVSSLKEMVSVELKEYESEQSLKKAVERGVRDVGIVFPVNFDSLLERGNSPPLVLYFWGESLLKDRAVAAASVLSRIRDFSGKKAPVNIVSVALGKEKGLSLKDRFIPLVVLLAVFISGFALPSTSLAEEKQKRTLGAVLTTPVTLRDVFAAKGLMGISLSMIMGTAVLFLNTSLSGRFGLILLILFLGSIMASCFGLMLGAFMKDISSVYSALKGLNIFIYGPGIVALFPQIPKWVAKVFPTYYVMNPLMEVSNNGASWKDIRQEFFILLGFLVFFVVLVGLIAGKTRQQET
ncbi:MAG: ABC transporter permease [Candidatus Aminicenantes bacterium]|nr:ABC transporter permease [Candidatus Aminicenantes bacterium]